jgi:hypothetical protein
MYNMKNLFLPFILLLLTLQNLKANNSYCVTNLGGNINNRPIDGVSMANINNLNNGCNCSSGSCYSDFTVNPAFTIQVTAGKSYYLKIKLSGTQTGDMAAWIDWDKNGTWSFSKEYYSFGTQLSLEDSMLIKVPISATGIFRLRVRSKFGIGPFYPCNSYFAGETEDYYIMVNPPKYCVSYPQNTNDDADIGIFSIDTFVRTSINNAATFPTYNSLATSTYSDFTNLPPILLNTSLIYPISLTQVNSLSSTSCIAKIWIDFNHDSIFSEPNERILLSKRTYLNFTQNSNVLNDYLLIPPFGPSVLAGITTMRVILSTSDSNDIMPCLNQNTNYFDGETEDYLVDIQVPQPCTGTPIAGTSVISEDTLCPSLPINVGLIGGSKSLGLSYQWLSANSPIGPFNNIISNNLPFYSGVSGINNTFYKCLVTCSASGSSSITNAISYYSKPASQCYCQLPSFFAVNHISSFSIGNFSHNGLCGISPVLDTCLETSYSDLTSISPINLLTGQTYPVSITNSVITFNPPLYLFFPYRAKIWIDYNMDGQFQEPQELSYSSNPTQNPFTFYNGHIIQGNITIPSLSSGLIIPGITRMRISLYGSQYDPIISPCGGSFFSNGEVEDYQVNIQPSSPCSGIPMAGSVAAMDTSVCKGTFVKFYLKNASISDGLAYQWKKNGVNIIGANSNIFTDTIMGPDTYQCTVTCITSGQSSSSLSLTMGINDFLYCYCNFFNNQETILDIGSIRINSFINNTSGPSIYLDTNTKYLYTDNTELPPAIAYKSVITDFEIKPKTSLASGIYKKIFAKIYIDYNHDGQFSPNHELIFSGIGNLDSAVNAIISGSGFIPNTALNGITRMRISLFADNLNCSDPCNVSLYGSIGEIEDYLLDIRDTSLCNAMPNCGISVASENIICSGEKLKLELSGSSYASGLAYQWQQSDNLTGTFINIPNANNIIYNTDTIKYTKFFRCQITCIALGSTCFSAPVLVTVRPFYQCYCDSGLGGSCILNIGNVVLNTLNNPNNGCISLPNGNVYSEFQPNNNVTTSLTKNNTYLLSVTSTGYKQQITAFIDYNRDGVFEDDTNTERTDVFLDNNLLVNTPVISKSITIPTNSDTGFTGLRVIVSDQLFSGSCSFINYGETEDYVIRIVKNTLSNTDFESLKDLFLIYPNPSSGQFNYHLPNDMMNAKLSVSDMLGRELKHMQAINTEGLIDLSEFKFGTYFFKVQFENRIVIKKIVISR